MATQGWRWQQEGFAPLGAVRMWHEMVPPAAISAGQGHGKHLKARPRVVLSIPAGFQESAPTLRVYHPHPCSGGGHKAGM